MRIMALDIGDVRVGIAISDVSESVASPICVLPFAEVAGAAPSFKRVIEDWEPELLVCGLPLSLSGEEGAQAAHIRSFAVDISNQLNLPLEFIDERNSSSEAKRVMHEQGFSEREMRGKLDAVAASLFLQTFLDSRA